MELFHFLEGEARQPQRPLGVAVHIASLAVQSSPKWVKGMHEGTSYGSVTFDVFDKTN